MSSVIVYATTQPTEDRNINILIVTSRVEGDHHPSSPKGAPKYKYKSRDNSNPASTKRESNGDPTDFQSWPTGRLGPFVPYPAMQRTLGAFQLFEQRRDEMSRMEEKVFHVAEFSSTGQGESDVYHRESEYIIVCLEMFVGHITEPELATRFEVGIRLCCCSSLTFHQGPHSEGCIRLL